MNNKKWCKEAWGEEGLKGVEEEEFYVLDKKYMFFSLPAFQSLAQFPPDIWAGLSEQYYRGSKDRLCFQGTLVSTVISAHQHSKQDFKHLF